MEVFLATLFLFTEVPVIEARYTPEPPHIDGVLDNIWLRADSATRFTQITPDEGDPISYPTTVYLLFDDANLYVAFKCEGEKVKAYLGPWDSSEGDAVTLYLDTFGDKRTCYFFKVNAKGIQEDAIVYNDGRSMDEDWDGVWYADARIYDWGYIVEMKIPFKSLRYKSGLKEWGINFARFINEGAEKAHWAPMKRTEGLRVSRFGILKGVRPRTKGRYLEVYPVLLTRYDKYLETPGKTRPHFGLDLGWNPTPELSLKVTTFPDFGEIEADPYRINLSKYRLYYRERRPFFTEGAESFRVLSFSSDFNMGPFVRLFYSRNIGRKLFGGEEVPISFGSKLLYKGKRFDGGILFARTESRSTEYDEEPLAYYFVSRWKWAFRGNSTLGFLINTKEVPKSHYARLLSLDLSLRSTRTQLQSIVAGCNSDGVQGLFLKNSLNYRGERILTSLDYTYIGKNFDINEIGFVSYPGQISVGGIFALQFYPHKSFLRRLFVGFGAAESKEVEEGIWERGIGFFFTPVLRSLWGMSFSFSVGKGYEQETHYTSKNVNLNLWSDWTKDYYISFYSGLNYGYNYRLNFFAWNGWLGGYISYSFSPSFTLSLDVDNTIEFNPDGKLEEITTVLTPRLSWSLTRFLHITFYPEIVRLRSQGFVSQVRFGGLISYQVAPKSWFYLAINDLETRAENGFSPEERISVVKLRYLILF
jgi:hypothetical protein